MSFNSCTGTWTCFGKIAPSIFLMVTEALIRLQTSLKLHPVISTVSLAQVFHCVGTDIGEHYRIKGSTHQIYLWHFHCGNTGMFLIKSYRIGIGRSSAYRIALILQICIDLNAVASSVSVSSQDHFSKGFSVPISGFCLKNIGNGGNPTAAGRIQLQLAQCTGAIIEIVVTVLRTGGGFCCYNIIITFILIGNIKITSFSPVISPAVSGNPCPV